MATPLHDPPSPISIVDSIDKTKDLISKFLSPKRSGTDQSTYIGSPKNYIINVTGTRFQISGDTFRKLESSMTGDAYLIDVDKKNDCPEIFIERHPVCFGAILDYFRFDELHMPNDVCPTVFKRELHYWKIESSAMAPCCLRKYAAFHCNERTLSNCNLNFSSSTQKDESGIPLTRWERIRRKGWAILDDPKSSLTAKIYLVVASFFVIFSIFLLTASTDHIFNRELKSSEWKEFLSDEEFLKLWGSPGSSNIDMGYPDLNDQQGTTDIPPVPPNSGHSGGAVKRSTPDGELYRMMKQGNKDSRAMYEDKMMTSLKNDLLRVKPRVDKLERLDNSQDKYMHTGHGEAADKYKEKKEYDSEQSKQTEEQHIKSYHHFEIVFFFMKEGIQQVLRQFLKDTNTENNILALNIEGGAIEKCAKVVEQLTIHDDDNDWNKYRFAFHGNKGRKDVEANEILERNKKKSTLGTYKRTKRFGAHASRNRNKRKQRQQRSNPIKVRTKRMNESGQRNISNLLTDNREELLVSGLKTLLQSYKRSKRRLIPKNNEDHTSSIQRTELALTLYFSFDFIFRLLFAPTVCWYLFSFYGMVDFASIVAEVTSLILMYFKFHFIIHNTILDIIFHSLQVIRIFRLFRIVKDVEGFQILLLTLRTSWKELLVIFLYFFVAVGIFGTLVFFTEEQNMTPIEAAWYVIATITTVGYGDYVPKTSAGRLVGSFCAMSGIVLIAVSVPPFVNKFNLFHSSFVLGDVRDRQ